MYTFNLMHKYCEALSKDITERHDALFIRALSEAGFSFPSTEEVNQFVKHRLTVVSPFDQPEHKTLWLDYGEDGQKLICTYWDRFDFDYKFDGEKYTISVVWGNPPPTPSHKPAQ